MAEREPDEVIADEPADETVEAEPAGDETSEAEQAADVAESAEGEAILVPHQPAGKRLKIAAVAAAALFVAAAAFAGAALQPLLADRALVHTKLDVARTAANAITTLWTYTPENMDTLPDRSASYLGGDFAADYRKYIDAIVAPNKQAQVTNSTQVLGTAVETLTPSEATAIVYTNSVATSPVTKNIPSLRYLSYRLTMERRDAKWLITRMATITSLDLTPQL
jgi:Mce-associated membrane protein